MSGAWMKGGLCLVLAWKKGGLCLVLERRVDYVRCLGEGRAMSSA